MSNLIGGRYQIIECLSSSEKAIFSTFLVEDTQIQGRRYIVKVIGNVKKQQKRMREVKIILSNPVFSQNLSACQLRGCEEEQGIGYLIFDYIEGRSLKQKISQENKLDSIEVENLVIELLEILKPIHQGGFVHNDIKPSNLIISSQDGRIVLIDFDTVGRIAPKNRTIGGTWGYAPPEQESGFLSVQNDLYAVGMTAIKALTGQNIQTLKRKSNGEVILPRTLKIRHRFQKVIIGLTHNNFAQRYFSCEEVLEELEGTEPTVKVAPRGDDEIVEEERRSNGIPWYVTALGLLVLVASASFIGGNFVTWSLLSSREKSPSPVPEQQNQNPIPPEITINTNDSPSDDDREEVIARKETSNVPTDEVEANTDSVSENQDSGLLFRDGRKKEIQKESKDKDFNVPTDEVEANTDSVSENQDSGLLFRDGR